MEAELLQDAPQEVLRVYWMRKREFEAELREVALTGEDQVDEAWQKRWGALVHPAVIMRTMETLSEFENGLLKLTTERRDEPQYRSWMRQLSKFRAANAKAKAIAGYFDPAPEGLGLTRKRSAKQNFTSLAAMIARNERTIVRLVEALEAWRQANEDSEIELEPHDLVLLSVLEANVGTVNEDPITIREVVRRIGTGVRRL